MAKNKENISAETEDTVDTKESETKECVYSIPNVSNTFTYDYSDSLYMEDIENRILFLNADIDENTFDNINYFIMKYNMLDNEAGIDIENRIPIVIVINSVGGNIWDGLSCLETIRISKTPVYGVCVGYALSMAFHIFANCHKRFATINSFFLNHEGSEWVCGHPSKNRDQIKFNDALENRLNSLLIKRTKLTKKKLSDLNRIENYMFADEAKELGIVDEIIENFDDVL